MVEVDMVRGCPWVRVLLVVLAVAIWPAGVGAQSSSDIEKAEALNARVGELYRSGKYAQGVVVARKVLALRERALGSEHPDVATSLNNLAELLRATGDYAQAEPFSRRALAVGEKALGPNHPRVATSLGNLAALLRSKGDYAQAELLYRRALAIREKALGPDDSAVATDLNNLAALLKAKGDYVKAEPLYRRALAISEKALGPNHPRVATGLNNLAGLLRAKGDYVKAEPLYRRALAVHEKALGPDHPDVAIDLNNLAGLLSVKGDYAEAEPLNRRALAIREKALGPNHPEVATSLNYLAGVLADNGDYAQAERLYRRALAIKEKALGPNHPRVTTSLNNLGLLLKAKGDLALAEPLLRRALAIREKALGSIHPRVADSLNNLAVLLQAKGDYAQAELLFRRALAIREKTLGRNHPEVAGSLNNLAVLLQAKGDYAEAELLKRRGLGIRDYFALRVLQTGSNRQKRAYFATLEGTTYTAISFHAQGWPTGNPALQLALRTVLRRKGLAAAVGSDAIARLLSSSAPADRAQLRELVTRRSTLSRLTLSGPTGGTSAEQHQERLTKLAGEVETLERELAARYAELEVERRPVQISEVQVALPTGAALVEYAVYEPFNPKKDTWGKPRYIAYVLPKSGKPRYAELGLAKPIDAAVAAYRDALAREKPSAADAARKLDQLVMAPVQNLLGEARDIYIAPDGALSLIPFTALVDPRGRFRIERYRFNMLTSGRDLLRLGVRVAPKSPPLILGGPAYGPLKKSRPKTKSRGMRSADFSKVRFPPLEGALAESAELAKRLPKAKLLTGAKATEGALKKARAPRILHIATHGFFLSTVQNEGAADRRGLTLTTGGRQPIVAIPEDPMLRAGLAFAGANQRKSGKHDDGILTAMEASNLDLWGTQLVVLSACETGVGEVSNGDGVYGLRRALVLSGSETQLMSLWKVDDDATRELMGDYYARILSDGGRVDALREAQLAMLARPETRHPYFWAAFIAAGDGRTLEYEEPPPVQVVKTASAAEAVRGLQVEPKRGGCGCAVPGGQRSASFPVWMLVGLALVALARGPRLGREWLKARR